MFLVYPKTRVLKRQTQLKRELEEKMSWFSGKAGMFFSGNA
jgi:hypothetical protein